MSSRRVCFSVPVLPVSRNTDVSAIETLDLELSEYLQIADNLEDRNQAVSSIGFEPRVVVVIVLEAVS